MDLFRRGLIYRGEKMLHYCPTLQSVVSDVEVDWQDITHRQKLSLPSGGTVEVGVIYDIKYPLVGHEDDVAHDFVRVSTTRPETIFGDVAVAVNSHDIHHMVVFSTWLSPSGSCPDRCETPSQVVRCPFSLMTHSSTWMKLPPMR